MRPIGQARKFDDAKVLLTEMAQLCNRAIDQALSRSETPLSHEGDTHRAPARLLEAMRYSALSPGKRLRPGLVMASASAVGSGWTDVLPGACAVEMIHAYSLIHDDLPILDDDSDRRGAPSCHVAFDEATALLAGDSLLTEAFTVLSDPRPLLDGCPLEEGRRARAVFELGRAAGMGGMVGGQQEDIELEATKIADPGRLLSIHQRKTGRLIGASCALGGILGGGDDAALFALRRFGAAVGLAFQIVDDLLDEDGLAHERGYDARAEAAELTARASEALSRFGERAEQLMMIAHAMVGRTV